jgi:hypothetical protein
MGSRSHAAITRGVTEFSYFCRSFENNAPKLRDFVAQEKTITGVKESFFPKNDGNIFGDLIARTPRV